MPTPATPLVHYHEWVVPLEVGAFGYGTWIWDDPYPRLRFQIPNGTQELEVRSDFECATYLKCDLALYVWKEGNIQDTVVIAEGRSPLFVVIEQPKAGDWYEVSIGGYRSVGAAVLAHGVHTIEFEM